MEITLNVEIESEDLKNVLEAKILEALKQVDLCESVEKELQNTISEYFINDGFNVMEDVFPKAVRDHLSDLLKRKLYE